MRKLTGKLTQLYETAMALPLKKIWNEEDTLSYIDMSFLYEYASLCRDGEYYFR